MTARTSIERLSDDAPVPHANSWPARKAAGITSDEIELITQQFWRSSPKAPSPASAAACAALEAQAKQTAADLSLQHRDGIIPPAERIVLDCLRALQAIPASERLYADQLMDAIAKGYLDTAWGARTSRRRVAALLRISSEATT